jgi:hypothetical protein
VSFAELPRIRASDTREWRRSDARLLLAFGAEREAKTLSVFPRCQGTVADAEVDEADVMTAEMFPASHGLIPNPTLGWPSSAECFEDSMASRSCRPVALMSFPMEAQTTQERCAS